MAKNKAIDVATKTAEQQAKEDHDRAMQEKVERLREERLDNERETTIRQVVASSPGSRLLFPRDVIAATKALRELLLYNGHRFKAWKSMANKLHDVEMMARNEIMAKQAEIDKQESLDIDKPQNVEAA